MKEKFKNFSNWLKKKTKVFLTKAKEWLRKRLVKLKRKPNFIPLALLIVTCLVLNLNLTDYSDTVAQINEPGMGLTLFIITLCSFLTIITFATAFPNRKKPKIVSIILVCIMIFITINAQAVFYYFIHYATVLKEKPVEITADTAFILKAKSTTIVHIIFNAISFLSIVTIPIYGKLLQKINTKVDLEEEENYIDDIEFAKSELD